jgi:hypothetical protein
MTSSEAIIGDSFRPESEKATRIRIDLLECLFSITYRLDLPVLLFMEYE